MRSNGRRYSRGPRSNSPIITEVSAGGVLFDGDRLLVLCKPNGEWLMPKGHLEPGETAEQAAIREVAEESGLKARIRGRLGETQYEFRVPPAGEFRRKRVHWFLMDVSGGELNIESTFCGGRFMSVDEALRTLTFRNDRDLVRQAARMRRETSEK
ncbi:MAG: NUDIX hydrolase [Chloroflexi bacterium]|nr:NUDIX hydrolase [Chloroflexota bacterium]